MSMWCGATKQHSIVVDKSEPWMTCLGLRPQFALLVSPLVDDESDDDLFPCFINMVFTECHMAQVLQGNQTHWKPESAKTS